MNPDPIGSLSMADVFQVICDRHKGNVQQVGVDAEKWFRGQLKLTETELERGSWVVKQASAPGDKKVRGFCSPPDSGAAARRRRVVVVVRCV